MWIRYVWFVVPWHKHEASHADNEWRSTYPSPINMFCFAGWVFYFSAIEVWHQRPLVAVNCKRNILQNRWLYFSRFASGHRPQCEGQSSMIYSENGNRFENALRSVKTVKIHIFRREKSIAHSITRRARWKTYSDRSMLCSTTTPYQGETAICTHIFALTIQANMWTVAENSVGGISKCLRQQWTRTKGFLYILVSNGIPLKWKETIYNVFSTEMPSIQWVL